MRNRYKYGCGNQWQPTQSENAESVRQSFSPFSITPSLFLMNAYIFTLLLSVGSRAKHMCSCVTLLFSVLYVYLNEVLTVSLPCVHCQCLLLRFRKFHWKAINGKLFKHESAFTCAVCFVCCVPFVLNASPNLRHQFDLRREKKLKMKHMKTENSWTMNRYYVPKREANNNNKKE